MVRGCRQRWPARNRLVLIPKSLMAPRNLQMGQPLRRKDARRRVVRDDGRKRRLARKRNITNMKPEALPNALPGPETMVAM